MQGRTVAVAMVGVSERLRAVLSLVLERSSQRAGIHYVSLDQGGNTDALVILLGDGLKAPDPARWGAAVIAMVPLSELIDRAVETTQVQQQASSFSVLIQMLDDICLDYFQRVPIDARWLDLHSNSAAGTSLACKVQPASSRRHSVLIVSGGDHPSSVTQESMASVRMAQDEVDFEWASSPDDALRKSAADRYDLAILDLDSLEGQAYRLCSELTQRRIGRRVPVLIMGQARGVLGQWRGRMAGCDGFIPGPDAPGAFREGLARILCRD